MKWRRDFKLGPPGKCGNGHEGGRSRVEWSGGATDDRVDNLCHGGRRWAMGSLEAFNKTCSSRKIGPKLQTLFGPTSE